MKVDEQTAFQQEIKFCKLVELFAPNEIFLQDSDNPNADIIAATIKKKKSELKPLNKPILPNTLCLGKFYDEVNRCRIVKILQNDSYKVEFIDYGNVEVLKEGQLKQCPKEIKKIPEMAFKVVLEYVQTPQIEQEFGQDALEFIQKFCLNKKLKVQFKDKDKDVFYVVISHTGILSPKNTLNWHLVNEGLAIVNEDSDVYSKKEWIEAAENGRKKNPELKSIIRSNDDKSAFY